jgi:hypothetical protein
MSEPIPVVVFAFNRPRKLKRILEALRPQHIDRLVVFIDGPRHSGDLLQVRACQSLARGVDWTQLETYFWEDNRGLKGLIDNISLVMEAFSWAIFVEDDCLPMPGYYSFMCRALERYRECSRVFSIGGYQPLAKGVLKNYPYSLISSPRFNCWGWASWSDRWQSILTDVNVFAKLFDYLQHIPEIAGTDLPFTARAMAAGKTPESWDIKVAVACLNQHLVNLQATSGLVRNIGLDRSGVHGSFRGTIRDWIVHNRNVVHHMPPKLLWLEDFQYNEMYITRLREFQIETSRISMRSLLARLGIS